MICHYCKEEVKEDATVCKHCGKNPDPNTVVNALAGVFGAVIAIIIFFQVFMAIFGP